MSKLFELLNKALSKIKQSDWNQNDSTQPDYVKNRTHYEETTVVNEPLNITWDGNTEGLVSVDIGGGAVLYKLSDVVLTDEQIKSGITTDNFGYNVVLRDVWEEDLADGIIITTEDVTMTNLLVFVRKDGATLVDPFTITFPEYGIYSFYDSNELFYTSAFTTTEPVEQTKTVVHKLDKKYLPEHLRFGGEVVNISYDGNNDGKEVVWDMFVKISDATPTKTQITGAMVGEITVNEEFLADLPGYDESYGYRYLHCGNQYFYVVTKAHEEFTPGFYVNFTLSGMDSIDFTIDNTTKLDPKYLPAVSELDADWLEALKTALGIGGAE